ncbi:hypothetical protein GCM10007147_17690 [Nocardiopsis kunsanensis]|uniref:Bifunctional 4-hydroxy-2-oxoglutarate aldolase/2-dehydro-3-deoxy-phosphogluconate aldolase n=1 Tax=Nocardiopsis kunsanensis TaxID=141693 RepID=A0A919CH67_9ACTN|nr:bifunctional 4-hydroxy-2-oxoglutarate aldolase/2-dehydro-3-deoxy-phosphogluconate aldolase [Nocardiopsis kunsanensis]GHD22891.1 hypothetical protein GCM10007147_17690 [Nocardiopsis kunsanensis]
MTVPPATATTDRSGAPDWADFFASGLAGSPVMVIIRGVSPDEAVANAEKAWAAGVRLVEVTVESENGLHALEAVVRAAAGRHTVGAGTVTTPQRLESAVAAGARFGVAPDLNTETVHAAGQAGVPFLPGVATPTEAGQALQLGVATVKAFPASSLGAPWVSALSGPYPELRVVATGGIDAANAGSFMKAGSLGLGVGQSATAGGHLDEIVRAAERNA